MVRTACELSACGKMRWALRMSSSRAKSATSTRWGGSWRAGFTTVVSSPPKQDNSDSVVVMFEGGMVERASAERVSDR